MTKRKKNKQPFEAISMGDYSRAVNQRRDKKEGKSARRNTSPITVFKPDADGNLVAVEVVEAPKPAPSNRNRNMKRIWSTL